MKPSETELIVERQVRAAVLADLFGISVRSVAALAEKGIIARHGAVYPLKESVRAYSHHLRETAARRGGTGDGSALTVQRERVAREQADALAMKNAVARRELRTISARWMRRSGTA